MSETIEIKERPILFSGEMVRAQLDGKKTQTRRIIKPQPYIDNNGNLIHDKWNYGQDAFGKPHFDNFVNMKCPYGQVGDRLWVRETWWHNTIGCSPVNLFYGNFKYNPFKNEAAHFDIERRLPLPNSNKCKDGITCENPKDYGWKKRPAIHMFRWASRINLEITNTGIERLQDITEEDAIAEGISEDFGFGGITFRGYKNYLNHANPTPTAKSSYVTLWESINGLKSWDKNPFVWVIKFRRIS